MACCPSCKTHCSGNLFFCPFCGASLSEEAIAQVHATQALESNFRSMPDKGQEPEPRDGAQPLAEVWANADERTRIFIFSNWLSLFEHLPTEQRGTVLAMDSLRADLLGTLEIVGAPIERPATLEDLGRCWQALIGDPGSVSFMGKLAEVLSRAALPSTTAIRRHLTTLASTSRLSLSYAAQTDVGLVRKNNEDNCLAISIKTSEVQHEGLISDAAGIFAVCDGMGGHERGEVASHLAIRGLRRELAPLLLEPWPEDARLLEHIKRAIVGPINDSIRSTSSSTVECPMGTTLAMLMVKGTRAVCAHVGDSRLYRVDDHGVSLLTLDHSVAFEAFREGRSESLEEALEFARTREGKPLTQALGASSARVLVPDVRVIDLRGQAVFLLCTDGLSDLIEGQELGDCLRPAVKDPSKLGEHARDLVQLTLRRGGRDNVSLMLVHTALATPLFP